MGRQPRSLSPPPRAWAAGRRGRGGHSDTRGWSRPHWTQGAAGAERTGRVPPPTNPRTTRWTLPTAGHRVLGREAPRPSQPSRSFPTLRQGRALKRDSSHRGRAADADAGKAVAVTLADQTARLAPSAVLTAGGRPAGRQRRGLLNSHGARRPGDGQLASQPVLKLLGVREPRGLGRGQLVTASGRGTQGRALPTGRDEP